MVVQKKSEVIMYKLTLTKEQAAVIAQALDLFSRIGCGQFEEILRHPTIVKKLYKLIDSDKYLKSREEAQYGIRVAKKVITGFEPNSSESIVVADEPNRIAYDIFQVIRNRIAWDEKPAGGMEVDFTDPTKWSEQPLPQIEQE